MNKVRNVSSTLLSDNWYSLKKYRFEFRDRNGNWGVQEREAYDRGNGAAILLYNRAKKSIILTRQFRMPTFVNGNPDGMMIEVCAGLLDDDAPEDCIRKESIEETGYEVDHVEKVMEAYMSPGSVTEILHFFIGEYDRSMKAHAGGGVEAEQEEIEVLEVDYETALAMVASREIRDAKTIMLLYHLRVSGIF